MISNDTVHLQLVPCSPKHLLALSESREKFEECFGMPAADGFGDFFKSGEVSPAFLARLRESTDADPWVFGFVLVHRESRSVIGSAGFKGPPDGEGMVEIAYGIVPGFQGRGYATEATEALTTYAFSSGRVKLVRAHTLPTSNASMRVLQKCGFDRTGEVVDPEDGLVVRWERTQEA